jgi:cupin 2 domain-containing protein
MINNLFNVSEGLENTNLEIIDILAKGEGPFKVEKIISNGQVSPENFWYDSDLDELVFLIQGTAILLFEKNNKTIELFKGDYLIIKAHEKHSVTYTSYDPCCIWITIYGKFQ